MSKEQEEVATDNADHGDETPQTELDLEESNPEVEAEAREMGWIPKDQFKGDPDRWRPASEYVKRGKDILPIVRASNKKLESELKALKRDLAEKEEVITKSREFIETTEKRAFARAMEVLKAERKEAIEKGDGERFEKAESEIKKLEEATTTVAPSKKDEDAVVARKKIMDDWVGDGNAWYRENARARGLANGIAEEVYAENPKIAGTREFLDEVRKRMETEYPQMIGIKRERAPAVEGGGTNGSSRNSRKKSADDLPPDARKEGEKFVRQKLFKDLNAYAKSYFDQE